MYLSTECYYIALLLFIRRLHTIWSEKIEVAFVPRLFQRYHVPAIQIRLLTWNWHTKDPWTWHPVKQISYKDNVCTSGLLSIWAPNVILIYWKLFVSVYRLVHFSTVCWNDRWWKIVFSNYLCSAIWTLSVEVFCPFAIGRRSYQPEFLRSRGRQMLRYATY